MIPASSLLASITSNQSQDADKSEGSTEGPADSLDSVSRKRTISDVINQADASEALPGYWKLKFDLTFNQSRKLTEIAIIHHPSHLVEYHLEASETYEPLAETQVTVKHANSTTEHLVTVGQFKTACKAVISHIEEVEDRTQELTETEWNSASTDGVSSPNANPSPSSI